MLISSNELLGYHIDALDGELGKIRDIYFDDTSWRLRYFMADTGELIGRRRVLVSPIAVDRPDWPRGVVPVVLNSEQVKNSPDITTELPVSRQEEERLFEYYQWAPYWATMDMAANPLMHNTLAKAREAEKNIENEEADTNDSHLRSLREVIGYDIQASDGEAGHMIDMIVDTDTWDIGYLAVDTKRLLPGGKVLLTSDKVDEVSFKESSVYLELSKDEVENAMPYDPSAPINREYVLYHRDFHGNLR